MSILITRACERMIMTSEIIMLITLLIFQKLICKIKAQISLPRIPFSMHLSWIFWKETVWELIDCLITSRFGIFSIKKSKLLQFERACFAYILLYVCTSQMKFKTTFWWIKFFFLKHFFASLCSIIHSVSPPFSFSC